MAIPSLFSADSDASTITGNTGGSSISGSSVEDISDDFMTMLVAEMQNQDPTDPMDNNELTSQLAQLNTAQGIQDLNDSVSGVMMMINNLQSMGAADWVGRNVMIEGDPKVSTAEDGNKAFGLALSDDADLVTVTLTDSDGNSYTATLKDVKAGVHEYSLDDLTDWQPSDPTDVAAGEKTYNVSFSSANADGTSTPDNPITALKKAKVDSVSYTSGGAILDLGEDGTTDLSHVYMVE